MQKYGLKKRLELKECQDSIYGVFRDKKFYYGNILI